MALAVTNRLVQHGVEKLGLDQKHLDAATRDENEVRKHFANAIVEGQINADELAELTKKEASESEERFNAAVAAAVTKALGGLNLGGQQSTPSETQTATETKAVGDSIVTQGVKGGDGASAAGDVRVKSVRERFSTESRAVQRSEMKSLKGFDASGAFQIQGDSNNGFESREATHPSEWDKAIAGVTAKRMVSRAMKAAGRPVPPHCVFSEMDQQIWNEALHKSKWVGPVGGMIGGDDGDAVAGHAKGGRLNEFQIKALLDDNTSGGLEAVPIEFDSAVIITPLLTNELWPLVNETLTSRRRIEGFSIGNFTLGSTAEGTAIPLFDTSSFIAAFDTEVHPVTGAVEFGLDFASDSPVAIADLMISQYGEAYGKKMDDMIASGNGTDEILGLINTVGLTSVDSIHGTTGPHRLADYESLLFAVPKQFRTRSGKNRSIFLSNEKSYQRSRSMPVDVDNDDRRLLVGDHKNYEDYMTAGHPHKINESLANTEVGFFCMDQMKVYRRAGFESLIETRGKDLVTRNMGLIVVRARVGGQMKLAAAGALCDDMKS
ncbi:phage major capsid protein [Kordiimonas sp.]|uniref:phage major capsid protein n=1 Tax=Kordiimonas sp. TaxID=1970157 RepID=UPI003A914EE1